MKGSLVLWAAGAALLAGMACSSARTEGLDPSKVPDDLKSDYQRFATRCSKCHSLARPLSAGIKDDDHWDNYVNRMRRQPGSGSSPRTAATTVSTAVATIASLPSWIACGAPTASTCTASVEDDASRSW